MRQTFRTARLAAYRLLLSSFAFIAVDARSAAADQQAVPMIPSGTLITLHLTTAISSNASRTGQSFAFELVRPITLTDRSIPVEGTTGFGTICLAGHAGPNGHEGDLTLRLDTLKTSDDQTYTFVDQQVRMNGRNRKIFSSVLGLIPFVGVGGRFVRGSDISVGPARQIETTLKRPASAAATNDDAVPQSPMRCTSGYSIVANFFVAVIRR